MQLLPPLSSLFDFSSLPQELSFINTGSAQALQGVFYKNYNVSRGQNLGGATSFDIELVSYKVLRLGIPSTDFALSINEQDLVATPGQQTTPITTIPISGSYRWGILQYVPTYDITQAPITAVLDFITIADQILGPTPQAQFSALFEAFVAQPIPETASSTSRLPQLQAFATTLRSHYGATLTLANPLAATTELAASQEILAALAAANIEVMEVAQDLYILAPGNSLADSLAALDKYFYAATGSDFRAFIIDLLIPEVSIATSLAAAVEFPRSVMLPVRYDVAQQKYLVVSDPNVKAKLVFAEAQFTFSSKGGFGYAANIAVSFPPDQPRIQVGSTGLQISFTQAKLDLSSVQNIPEANADLRPIDFKGLYIDSAAVYFPENWNIQGNPIIAARHVLIGTGGLSGDFSVTSAIANGWLIEAKLFNDVDIKFSAFSFSLSQKREYPPLMSPDSLLSIAFIAQTVQ